MVRRKRWNGEWTQQNIDVDEDICFLMHKHHSFVLQILILWLQFDSLLQTLVWIPENTANYTSNKNPTKTLFGFKEINQFSFENGSNDKLFHFEMANKVSIRWNTILLHALKTRKLLFSGNTSFSIEWKQKECVRKCTNGMMFQPFDLKWCQTLYDLFLFAN